MVSTDTVLHKGLLFKKGSGVGYPFGRRNWRTRHFVLTARQLSYYTYEDGKWRGALDLTTCVDVNDKTQNRAIEVMPTDSPKTGSSASTIWRIAVNTRERRMLVAATSEREMNEWVEMLTLAIQINHKKLYVPRAIVQRMSLPDTANSGISDSLAFVADYHPMSNREPRTSIDGQRKILQAEAEAEALTRQQDEQFNDEVHQLLLVIHAKRTRRRSVPTELDATFQSHSSMPKSKSISDFQNFAPHKNRSSFVAFPRSQGSRRSLDSLWDREDSWEETKDEEEKTNEVERNVEIDKSNYYVTEQPRIGSRARSNTFGRFRTWLTRATATNNQGEYAALRAGLGHSVAILCGYAVILEVHEGSNIIIAQQRGYATVQAPHLKPIARRVNLRREHNKTADFMANFAMGTKSTRMFDSQCSTIEDAPRFRKAELFIAQDTAHVQEENYWASSLSPYYNNSRFLK